KPAAQTEPSVHPPVKMLFSPARKLVASEPVRTNAPLKKPPAVVAIAGNSLSEKKALPDGEQAIEEPPSEVLAEKTAPPSAVHDQHADAVLSDDNSERNKLSVRKRLERYKHYPASARRRGIEGAVDVSFRLNADGRAEQMQLVSGSGYSILDNAALSTVRRAEPFPVHEGFYRFRLLFIRS
ncbi:MAG: TonB family protein, partial [Mariprofundaceae bacterium]|nr:TonB family protein [Mariprofundaceae bacterium]